MSETRRLYHAVRLANALLFTFAMGLAVDHSVADALGRFTETPHWASDQRQLVILDRTGDPEWRAATRTAVDVWNDAAAGTGLRLTWRSGSANAGACRSQGTTIAVCPTGQAELGDRDNLGREGLAQVRLGPSHAANALVKVCNDCDLDDARRRLVATHEVGHALGLPHSPRVESLMSATGGRETPDAIDIDDLRQLYAHADDSERCGVFNLSVGALCF